MPTSPHPFEIALRNAQEPSRRKVSSIQNKEKQRLHFPPPFSPPQNSLELKHQPLPPLLTETIIIIITSPASPSNDQTNPPDTRSAPDSRPNHPGSRVETAGLLLLPRPDYPDSPPAAVRRYHYVGNSYAPQSQHRGRDTRNVARWRGRSSCSAHWTRHSRRATPAVFHGRGS